jgi:integrase
MSRMQRDLFPWLGNLSIRQIDALTLLRTLQRVEARGAIETAHRILQNCSQIFRYAIATGRASYNLANDLKDALAPPVATSFATITDSPQIGRLLHAIDGYHGILVTRCALQREDGQDGTVRMGRLSGGRLGSAFIFDV